MKPLYNLYIAILIAFLWPTLPVLNAAPIPVVNSLDVENDTIILDDEYDSVDVKTASQAFLFMPANVLDLITPAMRLDMIDYLAADTVRQIPNALGGLSSFIRPVNDSYLNVRITPVSTMTFKILPHKKSNIVAVTYTISDEGHAGDSEIAFYDNKMHPLKTAKFIKVAEIDDFFSLPKDKKHLKKELMALVPFPTVKYTLNPDNQTLTASLTIKQYMPTEDYMKLRPYLKPELTYHWTGSKFELSK